MTEVFNFFEAIFLVFLPASIIVALAIGLLIIVLGLILAVIVKLFMWLFFKGDSGE